MHPILLLRSLILLALANGTPIIAKRLLGTFLARPLDGGLRLGDGQPLFGSSKTVRGILLAVLVTAAGAPLVGLPVWIGALVGVAAMAGDLFSSFVKRRFRLAPSSRALGLDQLPESLLPLLVGQRALGLTGVDIVAAVFIFYIGEQILSRLLYKAHIRDQPY